MQRFHELTVAERRPDAEDAVSLLLAVPPEIAPEFEYAHGQHVTIRREFDGRDERRTYSVCASVADRAIRVNVRRHPEGRFSLWLNDEVRPGDTLQVLPPMGHFRTELDSARSGRYAAFAAGSGITPIYSIVKTTLESEPSSHFTLVYGNRTTGSVMLLEALEELKDRYPTRFSLTYVLSRESQDVELFNGRIDAEKIETLIGTAILPQDVDEFFVCAPRGMLDAVRTVLSAHGVPPERIHAELFSTGQIEAPAERRDAGVGAEDAEESEVCVILDGKRTELRLAPGAEPILDAVMAVRPDVPFACKAGMCSTCRAKVIEGEVEMEANYALEDDEVAAGYVLTCQSHPVSDRVVIDYDA